MGADFPDLLARGFRDVTAKGIEARREAGQQHELPHPRHVLLVNARFPLAFDDVRQINDASIWLQNQPRSYDEAAGQHHPGAEFVCAVGEEWCAAVLDELFDTLEKKRFDDPQDEDRRLRLLLIYWSGYGAAGETLPNIMAMLDQWRAPLAA